MSEIEIYLTVCGAAFALGYVSSWWQRQRAERRNAEAAIAAFEKAEAAADAAASANPCWRELDGEELEHGFKCSDCNGNVDVRAYRRDGDHRFAPETYRCRPCRALYLAS